MTCSYFELPAPPAVPVGKAAGDAVIGGTVNVGGPLRVRVARVGADTALAQIVRLVETAQVSWRQRSKDIASTCAGGGRCCRHGYNGCLPGFQFRISPQPHPPPRPLGTPAF
jgi:hypothetical protein